MFLILCQCFRLHIFHGFPFIIQSRISKSDIMQQASYTDIMNYLLIHIHPKCRQDSERTQTDGMFVNISTSFLNIKYFFYNFFFIQNIGNDLIRCLGQPLQFFVILVSMSLQNTFYFTSYCFFYIVFKYYDFVGLVFFYIDLQDTHFFYFRNILFF